MIDLLYKDFVLLEKRFHDTQNYSLTGKALVQESLFNEVAGSKRLQHS